MVYFSNLCRENFCAEYFSIKFALATTSLCLGLVTIAIFRRAFFSETELSRARKISVSKKEIKPRLSPASEISVSETEIKPRLSPASEVSVSKTEIKQGQGDYIIYYEDKEIVDVTTFKKVYKIINEFTPEKLSKDPSKFSERYSLIKKAVTQIDPKIKIFFIPRTLYEVAYIRMCIQESIEAREDCLTLLPMATESMPPKCLQEYKLKRKCVHHAPFLNKNAEESNWGNNDSVVDLAYRINNEISKNFKPTSEGFTFEELLSIFDKNIAFLNDYYDRNSTESKKDTILFQTSFGPTSYFAPKNAVNSEHKMSMKTENAIKIVHSALRLDCSEIAQNSLILYRSARFDKDSIETSSGKQKSLSFGTGLFAGSIWDPGATPFYIAQDSANDIYAIHLPVSELAIAPFYIPPSQTLVQLLGRRESFHPRSLFSKEVDLENVDMGNICAVGSSNPNYLRSSFTESAIKSSLLKYKSSAISLTN